MGASMTQSCDELIQVLKRFPASAPWSAADAPQSVTSGLSGARVWRVVCGTGRWALRRWPAGYDERRLHWIHEIVDQLPKSLPIPVPARANDGRSFVMQGGALWSLEPWLDGAADFWQKPSEQKLAAALRVLAEFHNAASRWPIGPQLVPAIRDRIDALREHAESLSRYSAAIDSASGMLASECRVILALARSQLRPQQAALDQVAQTTSLLIPCIRDLWHDHVLFSGDRVTGMIDFGAMRHDSVATDMARLVGSLIGGDERPWEIALQAYRTLRPFSDDDQRLAKVIDGSSQVIAGLNWIRWLLVEKRSFENPSLVRERINRIAQRLVNLDRIYRN